MTIIPDRLPDLDTLHLAAGAHSSWSDGACVLEAVAYIAGEPWTDHPDCASPIIGAFLRTWNDALPDDDRQLLKQYVPRLVGSRGTAEQEDARGWLALDWLVRAHTPAWLRLAGLTEQAARLAGLPEFQAGMDVTPIKPVLQAARDAARAAAWDAAGDAAGFAARAAAWDAARVAARVAAVDAAGVAARAAAWGAARAAAWGAARVAARDAAWGAAGAAARAAAWDAARAAAGVALRPTVVELQVSAHDLVDRMLAVTETAA